MMRALALLFAMLLVGCVSLLPEARPPAQRYLVDAATFDDAESAAKVDWSLAIEDPIATRAYDTPRIAVMREAGRVEYLANGEWADRGPRLFQAALIRSFENSGRILGVGDRVMMPTSNFILQSDIRALHVDYLKNDPEAAISVYTRLTNSRGKVFAARLFERSVSAGRGSSEDIGEAFDQAIVETLAEIVSWSFEEGEKAFAEKRQSPALQAAPELVR